MEKWAVSSGSQGSPPRGGTISHFQDANGVSIDSLGECDGDVRIVVSSSSLSAWYKS